MKVLFLAAEATPLVKVGGLADVAGELPRALQPLGVEVRLALPLHPRIETAGLTFRPAGSLEVTSTQGPLRAEVFSGDVEGLPLLLIGGGLIRAAAAIYAEPGEDARKYVFFSLAALAAADLLEWQPDVVHANDWHTAASLVWLKHHRQRAPHWRTTAGIFTIHNLAYMGAGGEDAPSQFGLQPAEDARLPHWAQRLPLPQGLAAADWLTTVSPTYAREIQTAEFGCGLDPFLSRRAECLTGILNGLDTDRWDPERDRALPARFSSADTGPRAENKAALQSEFELPIEARTPVIGMVTRLDRQKGVDLAFEGLTQVADHPWQFILLGTGDPALEAAARAFAGELPDRVRLALRFDAELSRRVYGGADLLLVPSRYEPCGLAQMVAMRYGCLPVVRATGGLKDTVIDSSEPGRGTGFTFDGADPASLAGALRRALEISAVEAEWKALQRRAMHADFSWRRSARAYLEVYRLAQQAARTPTS